jgi:phosphate:Na+ symporter
MVSLGLRRIAEDITISAATSEIILGYHAQIEKGFHRTLKIINEEDHKALKKVRAMKLELAHLADKLARHEMERLRSDDPNRVGTYAREVEIIDHLTNIYSHCRRIAKSVIDVKGTNGDE